MGDEEEEEEEDDDAEEDGEDSDDGVEDCLCKVLTSAKPLCLLCLFNLSSDAE